ncbi:MAG TPA: PGPGW domain-containing protein [Arenicellales bacterium]|nr:PGPGW domain-containing protein [Arenicellales bacterium]
MRSYFESKVDSVKRWPRVFRVSAGILLVLGGLLGFFPVLGFWMIPLGLIILAVDFRWARHALVNLKWRLRAWRRRYFPRKNARREEKSRQR